MMNEQDRERIIAAGKCAIGDDGPGKRCKNCPYGYGYLDETGDSSFWWCDTDKIMNDAIALLELYGQMEDGGK